MISDILFDLVEDLVGHEGLPAVRTTILPEALKELDEEMSSFEYTKTYGEADQNAIARFREDLKTVVNDENSRVKPLVDKATELANFISSF